MVERNMDSTAFRFLSALVVFVGGIFGTLLPVCVRGNKLVLRLGDFFSAGVLLSGGLVHMLSDSAEAMSAQDEENGFPFPFFYCGKLTIYP